MAPLLPDGDGALRRALAEHELVLFYQPAVDLNDASVGGVEALVRWRQEEGVLTAGEFLPGVCDPAVLDALTLFVLDGAAAQAADWRRRFDSWLFPVAVNVSASDFTDDLVERVTEVRDRHGLPRGALALDISEPVLLAESDANRRRVDALKAAGVQIVVDDFGTVFATQADRADDSAHLTSDDLMLSLVALEDFAVDVVKLDRRLIDRCFGDPREAQVIQGIVRLAHLFGFRVLAEGVESGEEAESLRRAGFDLGQGYYFQRPKGPGHIDRLLHDLADAREAFAAASKPAAAR